MSPPNGFIPHPQWTTHVTSVTSAVPDVQLVSIEHPCIVKNFNNGFKSLGGEQQLKQVLEDESNPADRARKIKKGTYSGPVVGLSLRPHDPLAKKLDSTPTSTHNVLIKVSLPKSTGRKRKRGTDDPFLGEPSDGNGFEITAPSLIRRLQDNAAQYEVQAVGKAETAHRFNTLPDLHVHDRDALGMKELLDHATTPNYDLLKQFHIDLAPGTVGITAVPRPPDFIPGDSEDDHPLEQSIDAPIQTSRSYAAPDRLETANTTSNPATRNKLQYVPDAELPAELQPTVTTLNTFLHQRPIASRLVLANSLPEISIFKLNTTLPWITTKTREGPWKDCVIKRGIDPTSDPQYRLYQVVACRPQRSGKTKDADREDTDSGSHVFDGVTKMKGRTYQLCDITDPVMAPVVHTPVFRSREEGYGGSSCGWYYNGTMAKLKVLMSDKLKRMMSPDTALDERVYAAVATLPEKIEEGTSCEVDAGIYGAEGRALGTLVKKEALRLAGLRSAGAGGEGEVGGGVEMIDPALMAGSPAGGVGEGVGSYAGSPS